MVAQREALSARLTESIDRQTDEIAATLTELAAIPALGKTGDGYPEVAELLLDKLAATGLDVRAIDVPKEFLLSKWGDDFEKTAEYIAVSRFVPRTIAFGALTQATHVAPSLHLTQHYDLPARLATELARTKVATANGRVSAPGVSFCRAGIAAMLAAVKAVITSGLGLRGDLFLSLTPDNHLGGETGAGYLIDQGIGRSEMVLAGSESGVDTVVLGYKGALWVKVITHGKTATAAVPHQGINAIDKMVEIHQSLSELRSRLAMRTSEWPIATGDTPGATLVCSQIVSAGWGVPHTCTMFVDRRVLPDETTQSALREILDAVDSAKAKDPELSVDVEVIHASEPVATDRQARLPDALLRNIRTVVGTEPRTLLETYYTELRLFAEHWGAEAVSYSPGRPSSSEEQPESVAVSDVLASAKVIALTIQDLLGA
jgi:succinyl-diaminopimelate desuccinylase